MSSKKTQNERILSANPCFEGAATGRLLKQHPNEGRGHDRRSEVRHFVTAAGMMKAEGLLDGNEISPDTSLEETYLISTLNSSPSG